MVKATNQLDVPLIFLFYPVLFVVIAVHPVASDVGEVRAMGRLAAQRQADWLGTEPCGARKCNGICVAAMSLAVHSSQAGEFKNIHYIIIYIHTYMYVYIYICIYIYVCVYVCMFACMHACIFTYIHTCIHTCIPTYLPTYLHTYIHTRYIITFYHLVYSFNLTVFTTI